MIQKKAKGFSRRFHLRKLNRFLKSRRGRILLITSLALGGGIVFYYYPPTRRWITGLGSRCTKFFKRSNEENMATMPALDTSNKSSPHVGRWLGRTGLFIIGVIAGGSLVNHYYPEFLPSLSVFDSNNKTVEIEVPVKRRTLWRIIIGGVLVLVSVPVSVVWPQVGYPMQFVGWQLATHPDYPT